MASVWKRGRFWYISYFDRTGKRVTTSSHMTHLRDAEELARQLEVKEIIARRAGPAPVDPTEARIQEANGTPIADLLRQWKQAIIGRGNTMRHANEAHGMALRVIKKVGIAVAADLQASKVTAALSSFRNIDNVSYSTLNHYLRAIKSFSRWLWKDGRTRLDPLAGMSAYRAAADRRYVRRALTVPEIKRLYKAADHGPTLYGMTGKQRGMLYRLMLGTGLRVSEVKSLRVRNFLWHETPPVVIVDGAYSKHRREDRQPMRQDLAKALKKWMKGRDPDDKVFVIPDKPNRLMQADLAAAKVEHKDARNLVADLHSLRHTFITECVRHLPPKIAQQLARHASITLTMDLYAHIEASEAASALQSAPFYAQKSSSSPPPPPPPPAPKTDEKP